MMYLQSLIRLSLIGAILTLPSSFHARADEKVIIGVSGNNFSFLPFQVADELGYFKKHGLAVQRVLMTVPVGLAALHSSNADYISHFNGLIQGALRGFDTRLIFSTANKQMYSLVVQPEIRTIQDLKGKSIGTSTFGTYHHVVTVRFLKALGIDPEKDVTVRAVGNDFVRIQQIRAKQMDASLINPPMSIVLRKEGFPLLVDAAGYVDVPLNGLGTTVRKMKENPEQVRKTLRALYEGLQLIRNDKPRAVQILARWLKMESNLASETYDISMKAMSPDGLVTDQGIQASIEVAKEGAKIVGHFTPGEVSDFSFLKSVIKEYQKGASE
jgi:ABC-type nitrate/sulfonate/bicarbonate transport system substrate-binding protein